MGIHTSPVFYACRCLIADYAIRVLMPHNNAYRYIYLGLQLEYVTTVSITSWHFDDYMPTHNTVMIGMLIPSLFSWYFFDVHAKRREFLSCHLSSAFRLMITVFIGEFVRDLLQFITISGPLLHLSHSRVNSPTCSHSIMDEPYHPFHASIAFVSRVDFILWTTYS